MLRKKTNNKSAIKFPLVSILTPCYNSGSFLHVLLDSILLQDYPSIEMYAINDGSTDNTKQIIQAYIPFFEQKGYSLGYIYQAHAGQSGAINKGLKLIKGKYLLWPDSDDYYAAPNAISKLVSKLEGSDESVSMIRCLPTYVNQSGNAYTESRIANLDKEDLFEDCIFGRNGFWYLSGGYMVKTSILDKTVRNRNISTAKYAGQNWQLLLPLLYGYKCLTIKEYLYNVTVREDSHSRGKYKTHDELLNKYKDFEYVLIQTLKEIPHLPEAKKKVYIGQIRNIYRKIYLDHWLSSHSSLLAIKKLIAACYHFIHDKLKR